VNLALTGIVSQCVVGATILQLCEFGHTVIQAGVSKLYTKKVNGVAMDRGVAFPVCISVNDIVCNHSPLVEEERVRSCVGVSVCVLSCVSCDGSCCWLGRMDGWKWMDVNPAGSPTNKYATIVCHTVVVYIYIYVIYIDTQQRYELFSFRIAIPAYFD
jgi:hypothetical protein